jgi:hypothetical protein
MDLLLNAILTASSLLLFCYWFRYSCLLILAAESPHDYTAEVADANQLTFPEVRARLRQPDGAALERLCECLERDFVILSAVLDHTYTANFDPRFEEMMLTIHFRIMSASFRVAHNRFHASATGALKEMTRVVVHVANTLGERRATTT